MIHDVVCHPDRRLETPCDPVSEFNTPELHRLVEDMFESMYHHHGVGLAAPQIGVMKRIAVIDLSLGEDPEQRITIINPAVTAREGRQKDVEGCLCLPGFHERVTRAMKVVVDAMDVAGKPIRLRGEGLLARALQHETDHLNGMLFIFHLGALKQDLIRRRIRKMVRAGEWKPVIAGPKPSDAVETGFEGPPLPIRDGNSQRGVERR